MWWERVTFHQHFCMCEKRPPILEIAQDRFNTGKCFNCREYRRKSLPIAKGTWLLISSPDPTVVCIIKHDWLCQNMDGDEHLEAHSNLCLIESSIMLIYCIDLLKHFYLLFHPCKPSRLLTLYQS